MINLPSDFLRVSRRIGQGLSAPGGGGVEAPAAPLPQQL